MKEILEDGSSLSCCLFVCEASCNSSNSVSLSSDSSSLSVVKASAYCEHRSGTMTNSMAKSSHATFRLLKMTKNILPLAESIYVRSWASSIARFRSMILIGSMLDHGANLYSRQVPLLQEEPEGQEECNLAKFIF